MICKLEGHTGCLVKWRLNLNDVIHLWLESFKHCIKLPSTSTALVDDELNLGLEWPERLKSQVENDWLIRAGDLLCLLVDKDRSVDETLMSFVEHIDLKVESILFVDDVEAWKLDLEVVLVWTSGSSPEDKVDSC